MSKENNKPGEPHFHLGENFSSAFFGRLPDDVANEQNPDQQKLIASFLDLLTDPAHREHRTDLLATLRNNKAQEFLVSLIKMKQYKKYRRELIAACWESGLDFSSYLIFYTELVVNCEYPEAIEAITVIDEMRNLTDIRERENAIEMLSSPSLTPEKQSLVAGTIEHIRSFSA